MDNKFNFFVPAEVDFEKAKGKTGEEKYKNMYLSGVASTDEEDTDEETLEPQGYVLDRFLKSGLVNYEHMAKAGGAKYWIGEPTDAKVKGNKFFVKAKLWDKSKMARDLYDTVEIMKGSGSSRKIGWSIEGKALQRDPMNEKRITKALITNVALTFMPKNGSTYADIIKGNQSDDFLKAEDYEFDDDANGGKIYLLDITTPKGIRVTVDKDFNIKMDKAMTTDSARALIPESLDGKLTSLKGDSFRKNIEILANYHKNIGFNNEDLKKIKKNIKNYF